MPPITGTGLEALLPLLLSHEQSRREQGRELARAVGDRELLALLDSPAHRHVLRETLSLRRGARLSGHAHLRLPLHTAELPRLSEHPEIIRLQISGEDRQRVAARLPVLPGVQTLKIHQILLLDALEAPGLRHLELTSCPGEALEAVVASALPDLQRLIMLSSTSPIPAGLSLAGCPALEWLRISHRLCGMPTGLRHLSRLRWLSIDNTILPELPEEIGALRALERLLLANLHLKTLPATLGGLRRVRRLNLSANPLHELPDAIGDMAALEGLSLRGTALEHLPVSLGRLSRLRMLDISRTRIRALPTEGLARLQAIDISHTPIETLPPPGALPGLRQVFVDPQQRERLAAQARDRPRPLALVYRY